MKTEHTMNNTTDLHGPCIIYIQVVITTPEGESWGYPISRSLSPPQTTSRLASLANFFFRPRRFFSPFFPKAEPGPRLLKDNPPSPGKVGHTTGYMSPTLFKQWCGLFYVPQEPYIKWKSKSAVRQDLWFPSLFEKTRKYNCFQMSLQRQQFLLSYLKDPECWSDRGLNTRPELTRQQFISIWSH